MKFLWKMWKTLQTAQAKMQFCQADRLADSIDFVLAFWPHPDLLAKMSTISAGLLKPVRTNMLHATRWIYPLDPYNIFKSPQAFISSLSVAPRPSFHAIG